MNINFDCVLNAIDCFLKGKNIKEADEFLNRFQIDNSSWIICVEILNQFFQKVITNNYCAQLASTILLTKLRFDFDTIKGNKLYLETLFKAIVNLMNFNEENNSLHRNSLLCISTLLVQISKPDIISFLKENFNENLQSIIEVLSSVIEESTNIIIVGNEKERFNYFSYLQSNSPQVFEIMNLAANKIQEYSDSRKLSLCQKILIGYKNWIKHEKNIDLLNNIFKNHNAIIQLILNNIGGGIFHSESTKSFCEIIKKSISHENKNIFMNLQQNIINTTSLILAKSNVSLMEIPVAESFTQFLEAVATGFIDYLIESPDMKLLDKLIVLTQKSNINKFFIVKTWKTLFKSIHNIQDHKQRVLTISKYTITMMNLLQISAINLRLSEKDFTDLCHHRDDNQIFEEINDNRKNHYNFIKFIGKLLPSKNIFEYFVDNFLSLTNNSNVNLKDLKTWTSIEAVLLVMLFTIQDLTNEDFLKISEIVPHCINFPKELVQIHRTFCDILTKISSFLIRIPVMIMPIIKYLESFIQNKLINYQTSILFSDILNENSISILDSPILNDIFKFYIDLSSKFTTEAHFLEIIKGFSSLIFQIKESNALEEIILHSIKPFFLILDNALITENIPDKSAKIKTGWKLLNMFFSNIHKLKKMESDPLKSIFCSIWKYYKYSLDIVWSEQSIVEQIFGTIKYCMRNMGINFTPYLLEFSNSIINAYSRKAISTYLYAAEFTSTVFEDSLESREILKNLFDNLSKISFRYFEEIDKNSHIYDDFFGMCLRFLKYCPEIFFNSNCLITILEKVIKGEIFLSIDSEKARLMLLLEMITFLVKPSIYNDNIELFHKYFIDNGYIIVERLILSIQNESVHSYIDYIIDLLTLMFHTFQATFNEWLFKSVSKLPCFYITEEEKKDMENKIPNISKEEFANIIDLIIRRSLNANKRIQLLK